MVSPEITYAFGLRTMNLLAISNLLSQVGLLSHFLLSNIKFKTILLALGLIIVCYDRNVNGNQSGDDCASQWQGHISYHLKHPTLSQTGPIYPAFQEAVQIYCCNDASPTTEKIANSIKCLKNKTHGEDDLPAEIYKHAVEAIARWLEKLVTLQAYVGDTEIFGCSWDAIQQTLMRITMQAYAVVIRANTSKTKVAPEGAAPIPLDGVV